MSWQPNAAELAGLPFQLSPPPDLPHLHLPGTRPASFVVPVVSEREAAVGDVRFVGPLVEQAVSGAVTHIPPSALPEVADDPDVEPVVMDCDTGHDDAVGLLLACASPRIQLLCVSSCFGNLSARHSFVNNCQVLGHLSRDHVSVTLGLPGPLFPRATRRRRTRPYLYGVTGLDSVDWKPLGVSAAAMAPQIDPAAFDSVAYMAALLCHSPRPVSIVSAGPLTNIAALLRDHRNLQGRIARIVFVGGRSAATAGHAESAPSLSHFNIEEDEEAVRLVLSSQVPLVCIADEAVQAFQATADAVSRVAGLTGALPNFLKNLLEFRIRAFQLSPICGDVAVMPDACAAAYLVDPSIFEARECAVDLRQEEDEFCRLFYSDLASAASGDAGATLRRATVCVGLDARRLWARLLDAVVVLLGEDYGRSTAGEPRPPQSAASAVSFSLPSSAPLPSGRVLSMPAASAGAAAGPARLYALRMSTPAGDSPSMPRVSEMLQNATLQTQLQRSLELLDSAPKLSFRETPPPAKRRRGRPLASSDSP